MLDHEGNVVVQGTAQTALWFTKADGGTRPSSGVRQVRQHDAIAEVYRLYELDGNLTLVMDERGFITPPKYLLINPVSSTGVQHHGGVASPVRLYSVGS